MNYLAHLYLSGNQEKIILGNFIGDFVKGKKINDYDPETRAGILLHREIDRFTDDHPMVLESKKRLWDKYHHYAAVIIDVFYDHFLAANWENYSKYPLKEYTENFYELMMSLKSSIPKRAFNMLFYMQRDNWLFKYQSIEGIDATLTGMSKRTKFESGLENASFDLKSNYDDFKKEFELFFPELEQMSRDFLSTLDV